MGEIAEAMLDGTLCRDCGEYIGDPVGYSVSCCDGTPMPSRREKKESNREWSTQHLKDEGIVFESKNNGIHLIVYVPDSELKIDFWPSTGKWIPRDTGDQYRGIRNLIKYIEGLA